MARPHTDLAAHIPELHRFYYLLPQPPHFYDKLNLTYCKRISLGLGIGGRKDVT